ncbi:MAG: PQQ-binding-like beta-propeller repeat protein [Planctomycetota bacterium]|nr:PQQ-binding-like beta-propeller repeat protein [Planctomycetota bacterium]
MRRIVLSALLLAFAAVATADEGDGFDAHQQRRLFGVRATNAARYAIDEARTALADGRTLRALEVCQRVLDEMSDDFFLQEAKSKPESVLWSSAPEVVREMLAGLDAEQRAVYERIAVPGAQPLLERALRMRDEHALGEVLRRYGASEAGRRAARVLASIQAEAGRHRDAALTLREGLRYSPDDAALWTRLVEALAGAGERRALKNLVVPPSLRAAREEAIATLPQAPGPIGWPAWGGRASRDATHPERTPPPSRLRARERTDWQLRGIEKSRGGWRGIPPGEGPYRAMLPSFRPMQPVVDGRTVYVADGRSVRAFDTYSAREVWSFDVNSEPTLPLMEPGRLHFGRTSLERAFSPVVAGNLIIATVEVGVPYAPEYLQGYEITTYLPRRILVGLEKDTGRMRWWMGSDGVDRLRLGSVSIVSAPAVSEGLVLAMGDVYEGNHNVSFLAFDVETGALRWQRPLGFGQQELNLFGAALKELAASPVAVSDGVAYASTGLGFIAAVDVRSGVPRWLASYDIVPIDKVQLWYDAPIRAPRHAPSPPIVYGEHLIIAPTDGQHVHVFDKRTGALSWRKPYARGQLAYGVQGQLLGVVHDGRRDVVLLTDSELRARALSDGSTLWRGRFDPEGDRVVGRGAVAGGDVLVPTSGGLQRFSLAGDGAYKGTHEWPEGAAPGNLLPLPRVLVVTTRSDIQWFYDWAAIEREVAKRRRENPDDPTILLEAGEMYLRGGGEIERALAAFQEARRVAERSAPELVGRAEQGLYATYLTEGDQRVGAFAQQAIVSYRKALVHAGDAEERVLARIRIHRALKDADTAARVKNLEALVEEAEDAFGRFEVVSEPVPAAAAALLELARLHLATDRPAEAIDALQRILLEQPDAAFPTGPARDIARDTIGDILKRVGPMPYRRHEQRAKAILTKARQDGDSALIEKLLRDYPNAAVVSDALLERARGLVAAEQPLEAARYLQRLLRSTPPEHPLVPTALAALAQAYRLAGARGAAGATLARLEDTYPRARVSWGGRTETGATFAAAEREALVWPEADTGPVAPLRAPLEEVHFEPVGDEELARPITLATDLSRGGSPRPAPYALMMRGDAMVLFDLKKGSVAWTQRIGHCQRAAYADGVLVVALTRELRGLDASTGKQLWSRKTEAMARDLQIAGGLVFGHMQDVSRGGRGDQRLEAVDVMQGTAVWSRALPRADYRSLRAWGGHVLLQQVDYRNRTARSRLLVYQTFDGTRRHEIEIPVSVEGLPVTTRGLYIVAGRAGKRSQRVLAALDIEAGAIAWQKTIKGSDAVCALATTGPQIVILRADGSVLTHQIETGVAVAETRVYVTDRGRACPFPGTELIASGGRITLIPWARRPNFGVVSFERRTGKLAWDSPYEDKVSPSKAVLIQRGDVICVMVSFPKDRVQHILVRLIDARDGTILQEIEPDGLSKENWIPTVVEGHGTLVIFGKKGASLFRAR